MNFIPLLEKIDLHYASRAGQERCDRLIFRDICKNPVEISPQISSELKILMIH